MTLQNLRYIIEVANCRSFSKAAQSLFMTQSALSTAIRDIEDELGIQIFRRTNRGVSLTPDGEDCLRHCKEIVERADYLSTRYRGRSDLRTFFSVSAQHLPFAVRAFNELLDDLPSAYDAAIRETETARILHDVSTGRSEVGVAALTESQLSLMNNALFVHDLAFSEIARLPTFVFLRRQHPLADRDSLGPEDLRKYPFVTFDQEKAPSYYTEEIQLFEPLARNIHVSDRATKMSVIRSTDAYSIGVDLPNFNRDVYFKRTDTEMAAIPFSGHPDPVIVGILQKNGRATSDIGRRYLDLLRRHVGMLQMP